MFEWITWPNRIEYAPQVWNSPANIMVCTSSPRILSFLELTFCALNECFGCSFMMRWLRAAACDARENWRRRKRYIWHSRICRSTIVSSCQFAQCDACSFVGAYKMQYIYGIEFARLICTRRVLCTPSILFLLVVGSAGCYSKNLKTKKFDYIPFENVCAHRPAHSSIE